MRVIADGDSSTMAAIHGEGRCRKTGMCQSLYKMLRGSLERLVQDHPEFKGRGKLTKQQRVRLVVGVRCTMRK